MLEQAVEKWSSSPDRYPDRDGSSRVEREAGEIRTEPHEQPAGGLIEGSHPVCLRHSFCSQRFEHPTQQAGLGG